MASVFGIVDGWEVRTRDDGSYGVYDSHGMISGPHGSKSEAISAALQLPRALPSALRRVRSEAIMSQEFDPKD